MLHAKRRQCKMIEKKRPELSVESYSNANSAPTATARLIPLPYLAAPPVNSGSSGPVELAGGAGGTFPDVLGSGCGSGVGVGVGVSPPYSIALDVSCGSSKLEVVFTDGTGVGVSGGEVGRYGEWYVAFEFVPFHPPLPPA